MTFIDFDHQPVGIETNEYVLRLVSDAFPSIV